MDSLATLPFARQTAHSPSSGCRRALLGMEWTALSIDLAATGCCFSTQGSHTKSSSAIGAAPSRFACSSRSRSSRRLWLTAWMTLHFRNSFDPAISAIRCSLLIWFRPPIELGTALRRLRHCVGKFERRPERLEEMLLLLLGNFVTLSHDHLRLAENVPAKRATTRRLRLGRLQRTKEIDDLQGRPRWTSLRRRPRCPSFISSAYSRRLSTFRPWSMPIGAGWIVARPSCVTLGFQSVKSRNTWGTRARAHSRECFGATRA
jgi:hypothetical protein